ncbi:hypothetical protein Y032_0352g3265 [Ancylostoma ceylanicum]|uniref:Uncharacterized protein n=1 Tax=Ancylostoma ceylanicum TaxID=53326 RepID=A0A016RXA9_9BILA|nr:hypothetical protein Y032_0352g3265 [Ancylostoma ceylanicum]
MLEVLKKFKACHHTNLLQHHWQGFKEVRELISNGSIRLSFSDKGGEFVVMPQELDRSITSDIRGALSSESWACSTQKLSLSGGYQVCWRWQLVANSFDLSCQSAATSGL